MVWVIIVFIILIGADLVDHRKKIRAQAYEIIAMKGDLIMIQNSLTRAHQKINSLEDTSKKERLWYTQY